MQTLHLFAGAGGGLLADRILGHTPIAAVEWDPYCCQVLRERSADGWFPGLVVHEIDIRDFDPSEYTGRVDCVSGGFPCQDISSAGTGRGLEGDRSGLWSEFARVLGVVRPRYAFIENSPMLTLRGLDRVICDLAAMGFDAQWAVISAADAGAPHLRERIWILADAGSGRLGRPGARETEQSGRAEAVGAGEDVADADGMREPKPQRIEREKRRRAGDSRADVADAKSQRQREPADEAVTIAACGDARKEPWRRSGRLPQSRLGRMAHGMAAALDAPAWWLEEPEGVPRIAQNIPHRQHRLKAIGNGQVPLTAALAWRILFAA